MLLNIGSTKIPIYAIRTHKDKPITNLHIEKVPHLTLLIGPYRKNNNSTEPQRYFEALPHGLGNIRQTALDPYYYLYTVTSSSKVRSILEQITDTNDREQARITQYLSKLDEESPPKIKNKISELGINESQLLQIPKPILLGNKSAHEIKEVEYAGKKQIYKKRKVARKGPEFETFASLCYASVLAPHQTPPVYTVYNDKNEPIGNISEKIEPFEPFFKTCLRTDNEKDRYLKGGIGKIYAAAFFFGENDLNAANIALSGDMAVKIDHDQTLYALTSKYHGFHPEYVFPGKRLSPKDSLNITQDNLNYLPYLHNVNVNNFTSMPGVRNDPRFIADKWTTLLKIVLLEQAHYQALAQQSIVSEKKQSAYVAAIMARRDLLRQTLLANKDFLRFVTDPSNQVKESIITHFSQHPDCAEIATRLNVFLDTAQQNLVNWKLDVLIEEKKHLKDQLVSAEEILSEIIFNEIEFDETRDNEDTCLKRAQLSPQLSKVNHYLKTLYAKLDSQAAIGNLSTEITATVLYIQQYQAARKVIVDPNSAVNKKRQALDQFTKQTKTYKSSLIAHYITRKRLALAYQFMGTLLGGLGALVGAAVGFTVAGGVGAIAGGVIGAGLAGILGRYAGKKLGHAVFFKDVLAHQCQGVELGDFLSNALKEEVNRPCQSRSSGRA